MFLPYRTLGYVTDGNVPVIRRYGIQNFLFNTIGNSWQLFNCNRLRLRFASPERESQISAIAALDNQHTCTAIGREIVVWKRTQEAVRLNPPSGNKIVKLMAIGNTLISLSQDNHLYTWDLDSLGEIFGKTEIDEAIAQAEESTAKTARNGLIVTKAGLLGSTDAFETDLSSKFRPSTHAFLTPPGQLHDLALASKKPSEDEDVGVVSDRPPPFVTSWTHPPTYQNKLVIGWSNGVIELWNIQSGKMLHQFSAHIAVKAARTSKARGELNSAKAFADELKIGIERSDSDNDNDDGSDSEETSSSFRLGSPITCLESAHILDVIAVGCANGNIFLLNLKLDELILRLRQRSSVTALSFRSDDKWNHHMISAGHNGSITLWDLKDKRSVFTQGHLHKTITFAQFLFKEPILITSGTDNAIIQWHFNGTNMTELRTRAGHSKPPAQLKWYAFNTIISGGADKTLRYWSPNRDRSAFTLSWKDIPTNGHRNDRGESEGFLENRERRIAGIDLTPMYHQKYPSCVTLNSGSTDKVTLWSIEKKRAEFLLGHSPSPATNTCFTHCGQFLFIAYADGEIKKYNLQSKALRASYTPDRKIATSHGDDEIISLNKRKKHNQLAKSRKIVDKQSNHGAIPHQNGVQDIYCAQSNEFLVSIGKDGLLYTWDIDRDAMLRQLQLDSHIHSTSFAPEHALLAVITTNNDVYLIDCDRLVVVREWKFSEQYLPDGRQFPKFHQLLLHPYSALLFLADNSGGMRTFDLTSGVQIDYTVFSRRVLAFDICAPNRDPRSTGDIIATTHEGSVGVYLWVLNPNRQLLTTLTMHQQHLGAETQAQVNHISLSTGNQSVSIDAQSLEKEQRRFHKEQAKLMALHDAETNEALLEVNDDLQDRPETTRDDGSDSDDNDDDDDDDDINVNYNHSLNGIEKAYYKKMKQSNHFLTVNVVRNMSIFDHLITKPKPTSRDDILPKEDDSGETKLVKIQRIIQQVLFKQLHNEMNSKLAMLSGISSSRWKLLTTKQAIAQRNEKIKQSQILVNKNTPFFLNVQTAQKKNDSSTTYNIDDGLNLANQISSIQNARNSEFTSHLKAGRAGKVSAGGMVDLSSTDPFNNDEPADLLTQCLNISVVGNISHYLWPNGGSNIFAFHSDDDDDDDDVLVSVNDRKRNEQQNGLAKTQSYTQQEQLKLQSRKEREAQRRADEKAKKAKEAEKQAKLQREKEDFEHRRDLILATLEHHYFHIKPEHPTQSFIAQYNINNADALAQLASTTATNPNISQLFNIRPALSKKGPDLSSIIAKATGKPGTTKATSKPSATSAPLTSQLPKKTKEQSETELFEARREIISQAYFSTLKDLHIDLGLAQFSHTTQRRSLSPLISYLLTTPPSLLSMQISDFESERDLYIFLHTLYSVSSSIHGGMLDAISSLLQHTLELHSLAISESPLLRFMCSLLTKVLSSQWKSIEMLLHSNIAVVNQLAGLHQGF